MGMMDVREKEMESLSSVDDDVEKEDDEESKKCCVDCKTTNTPLWRGGPAGPKSLCNACGIRYRKRRISMISMNRGSGDRKKKRIQNNNNNNGGELKIRLMGFGKGVILLKKQRRCQRRRMKFGEEEQQAAVSLMALSSSSANAGCSDFA